MNAPQFIRIGDEKYVNVAFIARIQPSPGLRGSVITVPSPTGFQELKIDRNPDDLVADISRMFQPEKIILCCACGAKPVFEGSKYCARCLVMNNHPYPK